MNITRVRASCMHTPNDSKNRIVNWVDRIMIFPFLLLIPLVHSTYTQKKKKTNVSFCPLI